MRSVRVLAAAFGLTVLVGAPAVADNLQRCEPDDQAKRAYSLWCPTFDVFRAQSDRDLGARLQGHAGSASYDLIVTPSTTLTASRKRQFGGVFDGRRISFKTSARIGDRAYPPYSDRIVARGRWGDRKFVCRATVRNSRQYSTRSGLCTVTTMVPLVGVYYFTFS